MIALVNYGMGNIRSVEKAFQSLNGKVKVTGDPKEILKAKAVVLPGVGGFADCMAELEKRKIGDAIKQKINDGAPYLGICLGLQILFEKSFEGGATKGLSVLKGAVKKLPGTVKVPHMGWNRVNFKESPLFKGIKKPLYAYFVHSYYAEADEKNMIAATDYGINFCSAVAKENIYALQFHPEKSGRAGLDILKNFLELAQ